MTHAELNALVDEFIRERRGSYQEELDLFRDQPSFRQAVEVAVTGQDSNGKMFKHQCRVGYAALGRARPKIMALVDRLASAESFAEIHSLVHSATRNVLRFGKLATYDIALRIAAKQELAPDEVYLHCGSLEGARNLDLPRSRGRVTKNQLPPSLRKRLTPDEVENFLCNFKDRLSPLN